MFEGCSSGRSCGGRREGGEDFVGERNGVLEVEFPYLRRRFEKLDEPVRVEPPADLRQF